MSEKLSNALSAVPSPQAVWRVFALVRWWHILAIFTVITLYWITPVFHDLSRQEIDAVGGSALKSRIAEVSGKHGPMENPIQLEVSVNPLVRGTVMMYIRWNDKGETFVSDEGMTTAVRPESVILLWALCLGVIIAMASAKPSRQMVSLERESKRSVQPGNDAVAPTSSPPAEQILAADVAASASRASDIYRRSTLLLAGGILMAFVGVSVFAVTFTTSYTDGASARLLYMTEQLSDIVRNANSDSANRYADHDSSNQRLQASVDELVRQARAAQQTASPYAALIARGMRPFGMLIFVEGIAWFLLRQYRALIEDYKTFVRIQLKRSNYLIALKAASTTQAQTPTADVIHMLITEDLTGRLSRDQTTEALETLKQRDEGPVLQSMKELKDLIKGRVTALR